MYRVAILDDEADQVELLEGMVGRYPGSGDFEVVTASSLAELRPHIARGIDILLTDIRLSPDDPDGIELVKRLFPRSGGTQVIYVTGYDTYHTRVYQTRHVYFLTKPVSQTELNDALDEAVRRIAEYVERPLSIHVDYAEKIVLPRSILYIESRRRVLHIHLEREVLETYARLNAIAHQLPSYFVRCHNSFLVNMDFVDELRADAIRLRSGEEIPVSRPRRAEVREAFARHMRTLCR